MIAGQHWTAEQVANAFAPSRQTVKGVVNWLIDSGIDISRLRHTPGRHWIEFNASIAEAENLLNRASPMPVLGIYAGRPNKCVFQ